LAKASYMTPWDENGLVYQICIVQVTIKCTLFFF